MLVTLNVPDDLAENLSNSNPNLSRDVLEVYALHAYRSGRLTASQFGELLHLESPAARDAFLVGAAADNDNGGRAAPVHPSDEDPYPLRGAVLYYEDPFGPAAPLEEWEVLQ